MNFLSYREKEIKNIMFKTMVLFNYSCDPIISFVEGPGFELNPPSSMDSKFCGN
jgi:hypothetical protein